MDGRQHEDRERRSRHIVPDEVNASGIPASHEQFVLKDLDTGMKSYVTDQEWVEKPVVPTVPSAHSQRQQLPPSSLRSLPPLPPQQPTQNQDNGDAQANDADHIPNHQIRNNHMHQRDFAHTAVSAASTVQKRTRSVHLGHHSQQHDASTYDSSAPSHEFGGSSVLGPHVILGQTEQKSFLRPVDHVKVISHRKKERDFANVYRWQRIHAHHGAIRAMEFSPGGEWFATAGADTDVKIWEVDYDINTSFTMDLEASTKSNKSVHMFLKHNKPHLTCKGHTSDITCLSWSKNDFLLSGGLDCTIRLWHPSKKVCLRMIVHENMVTTLSFHPTDEQICITGTSTGTISMWDVKEKRLLAKTNTDEFISCLAITPDGTNVLVGTLYGRCKFYALFDEILGEWQFKHTTQLDVRSTRLKRRKVNKKNGGHLRNGKKICGFHFFTVNKVDRAADGVHSSNILSSLASNISLNDEKVLVTSNDSRLRLYRLDDKSMMYKFTGCVNESSRLTGCFDPKRRFVLCPSEERKIYLWDVEQQHLHNQIRDILRNQNHNQRTANADSDEDDSDDNATNNNEFDTMSQSYATAIGVGATPSGSIPQTSTSSILASHQQQTQESGAPKIEIGIAHESFVVQDSGNLTAATFAPKVIPKEVMNSRGAYSNPKTSGLTIVTADDSGDIRVFGCC